MFRVRVGLIVGLVAASLVACGSAPPLGPGTLRSSRLDTLPMPDHCAGGAKQAFIPTTMDIQDVGQGYPVIGLPRDGNDTPRTPPVSAKTTVAWDAPGNKPGGELGNVLFNAHTWPDGSALGNGMLAGAQVGDVITVRGDHEKLCYRITERVEVPANADYGKFWIADGPPQLAFIVCSGRRLGPGNWSHRMIWFAQPYLGPGKGSPADRRQHPVDKTS